MNKAHCIIHFLMLYCIIGLLFETLTLQIININLSQALDITHRSLRIEHETFKACERGELEAYRTWKRRLLTE